MAEKKLTLRQVEAKIKAIDEGIDKLRERVAKMATDKKELQVLKRKLSAAKTAKAAATNNTATAKKKPAAKKAAVRKTTAKKPAAKRTAKKEENLLGGLMEGLKDAGLNPEDLLKSLLGGK